MNTQLEQEIRKNTRTPLALGNAELRNGDFAKAITHYATVMLHRPELTKSISANLAIVRQKYQASRKNSPKARAAVCGWELAHNAAGRAYTLATIYETFADVEIIGSMFPSFGREIWKPIRDTKIQKHTFIVEEESKFIEQAIKLVAAHPYDIVHLSKPRAPNIFIGVLYKLLWGAKVLMDIDDEELSFVGKDAPINIVDYIQKHGKLPELKELAGPDWTRLAVGLAKEFDGVTVSNKALQHRYGGELVRHARDESLFELSPELKRQSKEKYGIPQENKVVLFLGTPQKHKGLIETAKAIAALNRQDVIYFIVGSFQDPSLKKELLNVKGCNYAFLPDQPLNIITEILATADCCVLLQNNSLVSQFQTPAKLADALLTGIPTLVTKTLGVDEFLNLHEVHETTESTLKDDLARILFDTQRKNLELNKNRLAIIRLLSPVENAINLKLALNENANRNQDNTIINKNLQIICKKIFSDELYSGLAILINEKTKGNAFPIEIIERTKKVDVIIPVFNALSHVQTCLKSLKQNSDNFVTRIIIVNDGSDDQTTKWLHENCKKQSGIDLIENYKNLGYTKSVNIGLRASKSEYVVLLNSDTIVTKDWLKGMIQCMNSDPHIGIVGPLSNAATWQSVPDVIDSKGSFAINPLPHGFDIKNTAKYIRDSSERIYPKVPFVNGFCFMIKRKLIDKIGYFDEISFPIGYGEENDYCIRATNAGFKLAIADDSYVFHAKSKSFGVDNRKKLSKEGFFNLCLKHTKEKVSSLTTSIKHDSQLEHIRKRLKEFFNQEQSINSRDILNISIIFILPVSGGGGGVHSIVQEVSEMQRIGVRAAIAVPLKHYQKFLDSYFDFEKINSLFIPYEGDNIIEIAANFCVAIATIFTSVAIVKRIVEKHTNIMPAYYVQDYEPFFFETGSNEWLDAMNSYNLIPNIIVFAKTEWILNKLKLAHGTMGHKVFPSIDHSVYKPQNRDHDSVIRISAMVRPKTPRRGASRTMRILNKLYHNRKVNISIDIFGCLDTELETYELERNFVFKNHGIINRTEVANILAKSDIFLDLSDYQAFGRTGLEAMACGCVPILPQMGGADEYAIHDKNSIIVPTKDELRVYTEITSLILNPKKIDILKESALMTAARYSVHQSALSELICLNNAFKIFSKKKQQ